MVRPSSTCPRARTYSASQLSATHATASQAGAPRAQNAPPYAASASRSQTVSAERPGAVTRSVSTATAPSRLSRSPTRRRGRQPSNGHRPPAAATGTVARPTSSPAKVIPSAAIRAAARGRAQRIGDGQPAAHEPDTRRVDPLVQLGPAAEVLLAAQRRTERLGSAAGSDTGQTELLEDLPRRGRAVQRDEVQPRRALGQQLARTARSPPRRRSRAPPPGRPRRRAAARPGRGGKAAPDSTANRSIWPTLVTGMMPGMIGTSQPAALTRSRSRR